MSLAERICKSARAALVGVGIENSRPAVRVFRNAPIQVEHRRPVCSPPSLFDRFEEARPTLHQLPTPVVIRPRTYVSVKSPPSRTTTSSPARSDAIDPTSGTANGKKSQARDILAAIRVVKQLDAEHRPATADERAILSRFDGFGSVALSLFPDPATVQYKDGTWQVLGEELRTLLSPEEYASAKQTTFNAFYTSPTVIAAMHHAFTRLGVPGDGLVLEPGCGIGNFIGLAPKDMRLVGVELDQVSGRIAQLLHPQHEIRIENFRDTQLAESSFDGVIGNVPFANIKFNHRGQRFALHDFFLAKSLDTVKPDGVLAVVTSHFTLDKKNSAIRQYLSDRADFVGAVRLPSDAFRREGTAVVTDILFLRRRDAHTTASHRDGAWLNVEPISIDNNPVLVNQYFIQHPEMVLGAWSRQDRLYGGADGYSVRSNGNLADQLTAAIERLPKFTPQSSNSTLPVSANKSNGSYAPPSHISEGGFFVGEDGAVCQVLAGNGVPVVYGGVSLQANGTMTGRRLAALIELRELARGVLQSQNEGRPQRERAIARQALNRAYDVFVGQYGPINKTTCSQTSDGGLIRRMPNLAKFREDPDAMLVMSLEHYDELTDAATKAAIMHQDVVGKSRSITSVPTAEEGLLVSLDRRGAVDLPCVVDLYGKSEGEIIAELGDLIYLDPETKAWLTADAYLSGNVREKLAKAEQGGPEFQRNIEALRLVQPEDVLPGDIDANLGAPWIPDSDVQAFACELFRVDAHSIQISHFAKDAVWHVEADWNAEHSVAATSEFGTPRANGTSLLEQALNMKTPTIYDTINGGKDEVRVVNQEATVAAREKQRAVKERFRAWVFADADRTERLVRIYNDTYNSLRPRLFDGSHLAFPGMNQTITLHSHQKDAVWRGVTGGNTLLAHAVGAGKTFTMAATGMKMRQAGLIQKPMYVVPNHMLEQFSREFMQLYPNARLLVATKDDMARDRRKLLTAKIASGHWDGIIVTHSSFERIGMSRRFKERFLRDQIAEYDRLLCQHAGGNTGRCRRNLIKTIEKQKAQRAARLKDLLAEAKKDDGLVFDELGVDQLFIDEAHVFKNLETPTKMDRVAGIQTAGSERAFDLLMKSRYLDEKHAGHGVVFSTGTPISNTMVEMYTVQRFLDPKGLIDRGIEHFDAWAATFGEVVEAMEISPDGASLRPRSRFAKFTNLPELQQMFRAFSDVQTAEMLQLPTPRLQGSKPIVVACPMSSTQEALQETLVARYDRLRSQKVDPKEDNALAITTDGRKLALDARLLSGTAKDHPASKVNALVENAFAIWQQTAPTCGTQLIFCDMGVHPTKWQYSVYEDVCQKLAARGIPGEQIAAVGDADSDAKKQALFDRVRCGAVRILLGSTQKMGTGTNVQQRLVALHHLDAPWKPAEVEQRDGRILRQGNSNEEVAIYRYVTEGSFDAYMWQALETKARFIAQVITGEAAVRRAEDIGGQELSYAEVKAIASGNPAVLTLAEADAELQRLAVLKRNHADEQYMARLKLRELPGTIERLKQRLDVLEADQATATAHQNDPVTIGDHICNRDDLHVHLTNRLEAMSMHPNESHRIPLGTVCGLPFGMHHHPRSAPEVYLEGASVRRLSLIRQYPGPRAVMNAVERLLGSFAEECASMRNQIALACQQLRDYQSNEGRHFGHQAYLDELTHLRDELRVALSDAPRKSDSLPSASTLAEHIKTLRAEHTTAVPDRPAARRVSVHGDSINSQIRRRGVAVISAPPTTAADDALSDAPAESVSESLNGSLVVDQKFRGRGRRGSIDVAVQPMLF